ncbi:hypothetical protein TNCV_438471 [Trichonephila clavipes]|nr:hypothetical protein TNCV_438471 [Trichonephila clavipes]
MVSKAESTMMPSELAIFVRVRVVMPPNGSAPHSLRNAAALCFEVVLSGYLRKTPNPPLLHSESEEPSV